ncbi:hypothetical protein AB0J63_42375 [Streptosporangium canum]|uniref:hypothetical protein n=1 Tax=Streptosporangium canum TaxID=324952 RepID=UPI0034163300
MEGPHDALAFNHVQQGDDDTIRLYGQDVYERTVHATTDQLLTQPAGITDASHQAAAAGIAATDEGDLAHRRLAQMHAFYDFVLGELPALLHRWHQQRG